MRDHLRLIYSLCIALLVAYPSSSLRISRSLFMSTASVPSLKRVVVVGASGYIGKYVTAEAVRRGYDTTAVVRSSAKTQSELLKGAKIVEGDVTDPASLAQCEAFAQPPDVVISCLASRSGVKSDSFNIDYQATRNVFETTFQRNPNHHFILLSAYCVRKPELQFQKAKLQFESVLRERLRETEKEKNSSFKYSIVRPTAFFKSVSGQFELVQQGWPFVHFGDGSLCRCNPIAERDLSSFMLNCIDDRSKWNQILNVGGPDEGLSMKEQGEVLFQVLGKEPRFWSAPVAVFDVLISLFSSLSSLFPSLEDTAELMRIGRYYAVEDMHTSEERGGERFGTVTLREHFERVKREGQEYDPYTTLLGKKNQ